MDSQAGTVSYQLTEAKYGIPEPCHHRIVGIFRLEQKEATSEQLSKLTHVIFHQMYFQNNGIIGFKNYEEKSKFVSANQQIKRNELKKMFYIGINDLTATPDKRKTLAHSIAAFIQEHQLDGVNLEIKFPLSTDKQWFITTLCKEIRNELFDLAQSNRVYLISMMVPRGKIGLEFDEILNYVDFLNVETHSYYDILKERNELTGPPSPIYSGHSGKSKENVDTTMRFYSCLTKKPNRLNMMLSISGRIWQNVKLPEDPLQTLWMTVERVNGTIHGRGVELGDLKREGWDVSTALWNDEAKTPYIWIPKNRTYLAFENVRSFKEKVNFAIDKNIGGFTVWSIIEDDNQGTHIKALEAGTVCFRNNDEDVKYICD